MEQADDIAVLDSAASWLESGQKVALATVTKTWGSSPRPPGSLLAMNSEGRFTGSVSGGCVEETLVERYRHGEIAGPAPTLIDFGIEKQEAARIGLPCGGRLEVLIEELTNPALIRELLKKLQEGRIVSRHLDLATGQVVLRDGDDGPELLLNQSELVQTFGPAWQLMLIGNGQLAHHLASMALQLGYGVTICDPRDAFASTSLPPGVKIRQSMPDDAVRQSGNLARTAIVTLAHDPKLDDLGLSAALESNAFYIGALGSKRTSVSRLQRLESLGYSKKLLARIHGPAGLQIGSKRPAEIAVSILAEITAIRNGIHAGA